MSEYRLNKPVTVNYVVNFAVPFALSTPIPEALPGMKVFGFYIVRISAGVIFEMSFNQETPFFADQGFALDFGGPDECGVMDRGITFRSSGGVNGTVQIMWFYAPISISVGQP